MNELQKKSEESKTEADIKLYNEQKEKVQSLASAAKAEYQTENNKVGHVFLLGMAVSFLFIAYVNIR